MKSENSRILVISSSLNPESTSRVLAELSCSYLEKEKISFDYLDLQKMDLPFCDGKDVFHQADIIGLEKRIAGFNGLIVATPVYNFDVNAALKNLIELTGHGWLDKVVGFIGTAGSRRSFMSLQSFASSLMLDFRCLIVPRFVFATTDDFVDGRLQNDQIGERIGRLVNTVSRLSANWTDVTL